MKIGKLFIGIIKKDISLSSIATNYEDLLKVLREKYKLEPGDLDLFHSICYQFRKVGRREPEKIKLEDH